MDDHPKMTALSWTMLLHLLGWCHTDAVVLGFAVHMTRRYRDVSDCRVAMRQADLGQAFG